MSLLRSSPEQRFPLRPPLPLPPGESEESLFAFTASVRVADAPEKEMLAYATQDFRRFVYTWDLAKDERGAVLELGANPYFTTMLLRRFGSVELTLANYFADSMPPKAEQQVAYSLSGESHVERLAYDHFNIEAGHFPYPDASFDQVLFCEIIEHLLVDPLLVLREIRRILRPGGRLVLTTPNVSRLENVARMVSGTNIYDPYSGYGPYGRHNREYNKHELNLLLTFAGFRPEIMFTADVHENRSDEYIDVAKLVDMLRFREHDLGQYIFVRSVTDIEPQTGRPAFLYRSYPPSELTEWPPQGMLKRVAQTAARLLR